MRVEALRELVRNTSVRTRTIDDNRALKEIKARKAESQSAKADAQALAALERQALDEPRGGYSTPAPQVSTHLLHAPAAVVYTDQSSSLFGRNNGPATHGSCVVMRTPCFCVAV